MKKVVEVATSTRLHKQKSTYSNHDVTHLSAPAPSSSSPHSLYNKEGAVKDAAQETSRRKVQNE